MKTNGSQSSHIQVDRQTIETALDDEVASYPHLNTVVATSEAARGGGCNEEKVGSTSASPNAEMMRPKRKQHSESHSSSLISEKVQFVGYIALFASKAF